MYSYFRSLRSPASAYQAVSMNYMLVSLRNLTPILILFHLHGVCFDFIACPVYRPKFFLLKERDLIGNVR